MKTDPSDQKRFQKNLELWAKTCPKQAVLLPYVNVSHFVETKTKLGEPNLQCKFKKELFTYHAQSGAAEEARKWFLELPLNNVSLVCVYGVGLGYYYDAISDWLKKGRNRHLVFLEDDLAVLHKLLQTERGTKILQNPQVQLLYFDKVTPEEAMFEGLYWNFAMKRLALTALGSYQKNKESVLIELRHKIAYDAAMKNAYVDEYLRYGVYYYLNFYQNMLCLNESYFGNDFFGKFHKVPAIICGAGPSLAKNLSKVEHLLDKAIVFAGGSALNVLNSAGLQPHFGAGVDPNPAQFTRMSMNQGYEVPFFYRNRMYHKAFKMIHGPRLYITGAGGYDTAEYFEQRLGIKSKDEPLDEGHNVVNFCVAIADAMGCDPIIFVGMDLAFTGMKEYAPGVVKNAAVTHSAILEVEDDDSRAIVKKDVFGKPTYTLWKWVAESEWIGEFAKNHPAITLINCTEGGLGFPGVANRPLADVSKEFLRRSYELGGRIHTVTQNSAMPSVTTLKVTKGMKELSKSLKRVIAHFEVLIEDAKSTIEKLKAGVEKPAQSGMAALAETELAEEPGYKNVVEVFNEVYAHILSGEVHNLQVRRYSNKQRQIKRLELGIRKFSFLSDVAKANEEIIAYAFRERKKQKAAKKVEGELPPNRVSSGKLKTGQKETDPPIMIPEKPIDGQVLSSGHIVRVFFDQRWKMYESYLEKNGVADGQALLYYPNGKVQGEVFYRAGKLHGPSRFWDPKGQVLAESFFVSGQQQGQALWNYPSGARYSIQHFKDGQWHGRQEYFYEDGRIKTAMTYDKGKLVGEPLVLLPDGTPARSLQ